MESNEKMIEEIKKLMEYDDLRNKIGCEIKKYAKQNHSIECIASRLEEVFDNALPMNEIQ